MKFPACNHLKYIIMTITKVFVCREHLPVTEVELKKINLAGIEQVNDAFLFTFRASSVLLFPTFWGLSYFFLLLGKIPTFSYFFSFLLKFN